MGAVDPDNNSVIFLRGVNNDLKGNFKAWCAKRGRSMTDVLTRFMETCVKKVDQFDKDQKDRERHKAKSIMIAGKKVS